MKFTIPKAMQIEHEELHQNLKRATSEPGEVGAAAKTVARLLHPHFVREEQIALPPLALLAPLARGEFREEMAEVLIMTDQLKAEPPGMLKEHEAIVGALRELAAAATRSGKPQYAEFAEKLMLHAQTEEDVAYPAAILVGDIVRSRLGR